MTEQSSLDQLLDGVDGWLVPEEALLLHDLAAQVSAGQMIVEVGSYHGRSTIALATGAPDGVLVYAVDPHDEHTAGGFPFGMTDNQAFMANISRAGVGHKVRIMNLESVQFWGVLPLHVGLAFIDGAHDYAAVKRDIQDAAFAIQRGRIAIHDSTGAWPDPTRAANELAKAAGWREVAGAGYTRVFERGMP